MANLVYVLCALTSLACCLMLWRGYRRWSERLLFWGSLCFGGLFLNNVMLIIDVNYPPINLAFWRLLPAFVGVSLLVYGLVSEAER